MDTAGALTYRGLLAALFARGDNGPNEPTPAQLSEGQQIFRFDAFGDETFWTDPLRIHEVIESSLSPVAVDGWPNLDLDPGAIIALSPALTEIQKAVYNSWGPGKYDARYNFDGQNDPAVIPPAYGLAGVNSVTYTGDGDRPAYWNRYVAVTQMHGHGSFSEPRLSISVSNPPDQVEIKLPNLEAYQLSLSAPAPPAGSFDPEAAARGQAVFVGPGQCSTCHTGPNFTDANTRLHLPAETPSDPPTHCEAQPKCTAPRPSGRSGNTRLTSMMAVPLRSLIW